MVIMSCIFSHTWYDSMKQHFYSNKWYDSHTNIVFHELPQTTIVMWYLPFGGWLISVCRMTVSIIFVANIKVSLFFMAIISSCVYTSLFPVTRWYASRLLLYFCYHELNCYRYRNVGAPCKCWLLMLRREV